ncbi:MAG: hypothetical protein IPL77_21530 [Flavobacteriales bacterium]|nr:hypothetical protein [Flavobacteriales bacterium]
MKAHPELGRERSLVAATKVAAGVEVYAHKAELRKREGKVIGMWSRPMVVRLAAAASIALLLGLGIWSLMRAPRQEPQVAEVKETTPGQKAPEGVVQERVQEKEPVLSQPETHSPAVEPQRSNQESVPEQQENPSAPEQPRNLREAAPSLAHLEPVQGAQDPANANPVQVEEQAPAASIPSPDEFLAAASAKEVPTLGGLVAQRMRGAVLDQRAPEAHGFKRPMPWPQWIRAEAPWRRRCRPGGATRWPPPEALRPAPGQWDGHYSQPVSGFPSDQRTHEQRGFVAGPPRPAGAAPGPPRRAHFIPLIPDA